MQEAVSARLGDWVSEGWSMFAEQWKFWVLCALVSLGILAVPFIPLVIVWIVAMGTMQASPDSAFAALAGVFALEGLGILVVTVIGAYFTAGLYRTALKQLRGEQIQVADLFSGGDCFLRVLGASFLIGILTFIGYLFCIVPGFLVGAALIFTQFLIVDKGLGVIEAMKTSYNKCRDNIWWFALYALILVLISQAGSSVCALAMLVTYPLMFTIGAVAYRDCFDIPGMRSFRSSSPASAPMYNSQPPSFMPPPPIPPPPPLTPADPAPGPWAPEPPFGACPSCRTPLTPAARFCPKCGTPISNGPGGVGSANA